MNLIVFSRSQNCVNTQYAALSGAMHSSIFGIPLLIFFKLGIMYVDIGKECPGIADG